MTNWGLCATKISAGVSTGIGAHAESENGENCGNSAVSGDDQFEIADNRNVSEVIGYNLIKYINSY